MEQLGYLPAGCSGRGHCGRDAAVLELRRERPVPQVPGAAVSASRASGQAMEPILQFFRHYAILDRIYDGIRPTNKRLVSGAFLFYPG